MANIIRGNITKKMQCLKRGKPMDLQNPGAETASLPTVAHFRLKGVPIDEGPKPEEEKGTTEGKG